MLEINGTRINEKMALKILEELIDTDIVDLKQESLKLGVGC